MARRIHPLIGLLTFVVVPACAVASAPDDDGDSASRSSALGGSVVVNEFKAGTSGWIARTNSRVITLSDKSPCHHCNLLSHSERFTLEIACSSTSDSDRRRHRCDPINPLAPVMSTFLPKKDC